MSIKNLKQGLPIIIRGGSRSGGKPISIQADGVFEITQQFQAQPNDWIESGSDFLVSYIESVMIGEMGPELQFCQTSSMSHPLRFEFKNDKDANIFTLSEIAATGGYNVRIDVQMPDEYFEITQSGNSGETWTASDFDSEAAAIAAVEVVDSNEVPVCRLLCPDGESICLNLEPAL